MGASESKLVFKQGIFRLSEDQAISPDDKYWAGFWQLPESADDVFSLFSAADIRRTRDASIRNLETLIIAVTSRLNTLRQHPSFPHPEIAPDRELLNCIRVLTRLLPFIYEADHLTEWEERFFWDASQTKLREAQIPGEVLFDEDHLQEAAPLKENEVEHAPAKPLAEELLATLIDLLFMTGFTLPRMANAKDKVTYTIWQSGVGCKSSIGSNKELESNRCEVLRLLLTVMSRSMYMSPVSLPVSGVKAITYIATCPDKQVVLSVLCSLLNTVIKHNSTTWRLPYDHVVWNDSRQSLVIYSLHVLLVLLLYPIPEDGRGVAPKNYYRHFLGRLHRPEDFQFLAEGMTKVLSQPMQATASILPGSHKSVQWAPEMVMLFWETLQCNKRFRAFIIESNRAHDFIVLMLFYAIEYKSDPSRQGIVRMCVFVLQTMSVEPAFGKNLNQNFEAQETLPSSIRISRFRGTYADFLVTSIHTLITTSKGKLDAIYPALLAIINNIAAYAERLSMATCSKLMQLLIMISAPSFLLANETNHSLLQSLLESINTIIEHKYSSNPNLIYAILRTRKKIESLRTFTLEGAQQEIENAARRRKEILGRGTPTETSPDSRRTSVADVPRPVQRTNTNLSQSSQTDDGMFTIGGEESDEDGMHPPPSQSSHSRAASTASSSVAGHDDAVPTQLQGMSEKARGKMPMSAQSFSRRNSILSPQSAVGSPRLPFSPQANFDPTSDWLESWLPELPLHTLLTVIKALVPKMPPSAATAQQPLANPASNPDVVGFLNLLPSTASDPAIQSILFSPSAIKIHLFEWTTLSLGWYTSVLWSLIFTAEMHIAPAAVSTTSRITNTVTGGGSGGGTGAGPVGVWNGTVIKLFRVADSGREGPSLSRPKGAVDAVGTRLVAGVQGLGLGGLMGRALSGTGNTQQQPQQGGHSSPNNEQGQQASYGSVREV